MKQRYTRLRIAFVLEGRGASANFAAMCNVTVPAVCHCLCGKAENKSGRTRRSQRLEQLADAYIREVFAKHPEIMNLEAE